MYAILNIFFFIFHSTVIVFNLFGWLWEKTRWANLITLTVTAFSWFGLGIWYGFGYCPSTDWHWQVRMKLGHYDMPNSYIKFLIDSITGLDVNAAVVDTLTLVLFFLALAGSIYTNWQERRKRSTRNN